VNDNFRPAANRPAFLAQEALIVSASAIFIHRARTCASLERPMPATAGKPFVGYEHVAAGIMQFDDSRVLHIRAEALDCAFYPHR
jgi:hypothetical protein